MPDIKLSPEDEQKVNKAMFLLKEAKDLLPKKDLASMAREVVVKAQIKNLDSRIKNLAQHRLEGGRQVDVVVNPVRVKAAWDVFVHDVDESEWDDKAMKSAQETFQGIGHFQDEVTKLIAAANSGKTLNIDIVDKISANVVKTLNPVLDNLRIAHDKALEESMALPRVMDLVKEVQAGRTKPPDNIQEVFAKQREWAEAVQTVLNAQRDMVRAMERADKISEASLTKIEDALLAMASAAVTWRDQEKFNKAVDFISSFSQGAIGGAQALAGEPIAHTTLQGLHMLVKGIGDGTKIVAAAIQAKKLSKQGVDAVVDMLKADDFAQMKLDGIKMALEWVAEPFGFIPNVGTLIRGVLNAVTGQIIKILKQAVEAQKEKREEEKAKGLKPGSTMDSEAYTEQIMSALRGAFTKEALLEKLGGTLEETMKWDLEAGVESAKNFADAAMGVAEDPAKKIAEAVTGLAMALCGDAIANVVGRIVPSLGLVDKDSIKETLSGARASVDSLRKGLVSMEAIERSFGFDSAAAKSVSTQIVKALGLAVEGTTVFVARSKVFKETGGVSVMIGVSGHPEENSLFMASLVQDASQEACEGSVVLVGKPTDKPKDLKLQFTFDEPGIAHPIMRDYVKACGGSGSSGKAAGNQITWKTADHCWK